ncbi:MAG: hypothetical protein JST68_20535 [Bacteroidetes bacterium]|nr:hypothetical protein [Bacteroidota bacterium]
MELYDLFYKWVPIWLRLLILFVLFFTLLSANGVYLGNVTDVSSGLGVYPEYYTMASNAIFIGMGLGFFIEVRLKRRFTSKTLLLWGLSWMLVLNGVCMISNDPVIVVAACLLLGFLKVSALVETYLMWIPVWSKKADRTRFYPFVYLLALGGTYFLTWLTTKFAYWYDWRYAYVVVLILVLSCLLMALIFVENHPLKHRYPLYQMDIPGILLLAAFFMLLNYVVVYGRVENWLESNRIKGALVLLPVLFLAWIRRELGLKRPLFPLMLFRRGHFRKGLGYFVLLGLFLPSTIQTQFTSGVLHFENIRNAELNLYLLPGVAFGSIVCFAWYYYKQSPDLLFFIGVGAFVAYYGMLYYKLATGLGLDDFWMLSVVKGFATVVLYIVVGLFALSEFQLDFILSGAGAMIATRSFLGSGVFAGIYSYLLYAGRVRHLDRLAGLVDAGDFQRPADYYRTLQEQAALAASKELCGAIILVGLFMMAAIVAGHVFRALNRREPVLG